MIKSLVKSRLLGDERTHRKDWLAHVRLYPRFQSKPDPGPFDNTCLSETLWRKIGSKSRLFRSLSGLMIPAPCANSAEPYKIWTTPGFENRPNLPQSLLGQPIHDTFFDYHPAFHSRESFILDVPGGTFHGHDHTLFDRDFRPIDWEPPYWALNCGLPGTLFRGRIPRPRKLQGRALILSAPGAHDNFWHLFFDSLPKLKLLGDAAIPLESFDHIIVDRADGPVRQTAFERVGLDRSKIVESRNEPLLSADSMTFVTMGCLLPPDPWVLDWLRKTLPVTRPPVKPSRKIFISRANARHRRFENEAPFREILEANGFETVAFENLTINEQIETMQNAQAVVAPHGAGLTNLVWCQPGTRIVELFAYEYITGCYWMLCEMLGLRYAFAIGERTFPNEPVPVRAVMDQNRLTSPIQFANNGELAKRILAFLEE